VEAGIGRGCYIVTPIAAIAQILASTVAILVDRHKG